MNRAIVEGISTGWHVEDCHYCEFQVKRSRNHYWSALFQINQLNQAMTMLRDVNRVLGRRGAVFSKLNFFCYLSPIVLACLSYRKCGWAPLRKVVHWTRNNIGRLGRIVTIVSSVALLALGQYVMAGASLAYIVVTALAHSKVIPEHLYDTIERSGYILCLLTSLFSCSIIERCFAWYSVVDKVVSFVIDRFRGRKELVLSCELSDVFIDTVRKGNDKMTVNQSHMRDEVMPFLAVPSIDEQHLLRMFDMVDWRGGDFQLLYDDTGWQEEDCLTWQGKEQQYLRMALERLIVRAQSSPELLDELKKLVALMESLGHDERIHYLLRLGVESVYRHRDISLVKEMVAQLFYDAVKKGSFVGGEGSCEDRILAILQNRRTLLFKQIYYRSFESWYMWTFGRVINLEDDSWYHSYINTYAANYGLADHGQSDDYMAKVGSFEMNLWSGFDKIWSKYWDKFFQQEYSVENIVDEVAGFVGTSLLSVEDVVLWYQERGIALTEELFNREKDVYLRVMLIMMGVLDVSYDDLVKC